MEWSKLRNIPPVILTLGVVGLLGLGIAGYGLWLALAPEPPKVEIVRDSKMSPVGSSIPENKTKVGEIVIDVAGGVEKPGVYKLPTGSRVGEALAMAGGLSAPADREWVSKNLNLALELKDGQKIYVPLKETNTGNVKAVATESEREGEILEQAAAISALIDLNTASQKELESLWGIGEARAKAIIAGRPYAATDEIISKAKVPQSVYDKISNQISVY